MCMYTLYHLKIYHTLLDDISFAHTYIYHYHIHLYSYLSNLNIIIPSTNPNTFIRGTTSAQLAMMSITHGIHLSLCDQYRMAAARRNCLVTKLETNVALALASENKQREPKNERIFFQTKVIFRTELFSFRVNLGINNDLMIIHQPGCNPEIMDCGFLVPKYLSGEIRSRIHSSLVKKGPNNNRFISQDQ